MTQTIKFISAKLNAWRRYRTSLRELYSLNDRELADLGVARGKSTKSPAARLASKTCFRGQLPPPC